MIAAMALLSSPSVRAFSVPLRRSISSIGITSTGNGVGTGTGSSLAFTSHASSKSFFNNNQSKDNYYYNTRISKQYMSTTSTEESTSESTITPIETSHGSDAKYDLSNKEKGIIGKYEPQLFESQIYKWWEDAGCFKPDSKQTKEEAKENGREPYVLPMPPPNVTGRLHMGHAIFVALQDVLARFHRMRGRPVLWLPGKYR